VRLRRQRVLALARESARGGKRGAEQRLLRVRERTNDASSARIRRSAVQRATAHALTRLLVAQSPGWAARVAFVLLRRRSSVRQRRLRVLARRAAAAAVVARAI
jgi:hypothetical protein